MKNRTRLTNRFIMLRRMARRNVLRSLSFCLCISSGVNSYTRYSSPHNGVFLNKFFCFSYLYRICCQAYRLFAISILKFQKRSAPPYAITDDFSSDVFALFWLNEASDREVGNKFPFGYLDISLLLFVCNYCILCSPVLFFAYHKCIVLKCSMISSAVAVRCSISVQRQYTSSQWNKCPL